MLAEAGSTRVPNLLPRRSSNGVLSSPSPPSNTDELMNGALSPTMKLFSRHRAQVALLREFEIGMAIYLYGVPGICFVGNVHVDGRIALVPSQWKRCSQFSCTRGRKGTLGSTFFKLRGSHRPISLYKENGSVRWSLSTGLPL